MSESAKNSSDTRGKILRAARELFAINGFVGTTTARIAQAAGVNEALIYRHFPAKKDLYTAILQAQIEQEDHVNLVRAAECQGLPVIEALNRVAERYLQAHDPTFLRLYYHSALEGHQLAGQFYELFVRRFILAVEQLFRRGVEEGVFRSLDPGLSALAFTGMFRSYVLTRELFPGKDFDRPDAEVTKAFCETFLSGIKN